MIARELFEKEKEYIVHLSKNGLTAREILDRMCETELTVNDIEDIINDYLGSFRCSGESIKQIVERMKKDVLPQRESLYWYDLKRRVRKEAEISTAVIIFVEEGRSKEELLDYLQKHFSLTQDDAEKYYLEYRNDTFPKRRPDAK